MGDEHPWDDPAKKIEASAYCRWVFGDLFPHLASAFNEAHGENHGERYWRIIAGPWLFHRVQAQYEKYVDHKCEFKTLEPIWMGVKNNGFLGALRNAYAAAIDTIGCTRPILLCDLRMGHADAWRICWRTRFKAWPMLRREIVTGGWEADDEARARLRRFKFPWGKDEFENIAMEGLAEAVPTLYAEHYKSMLAYCEPFLRGKQKLFVSGAGWKSNEHLKFIAACASERGAKLAAVQHGGNTGWTAIHPMEDFARETADEFITWGIRPDGMEAHPLPDPKLNRLVRHRKPPREEGPILFVGTAFARYASASVRTQPMSRQTLRYMDWQNDFFRSVGELRREFIVRTYPADYGWQNKLRLLEEFPKLRLDYFDYGVARYLRECRLVVIDNPQTTFLEALAMDKPCVLYFDPELWKMRPEAEARFKALNSAGIAHFSPSEAAAQVQKIASDPWAWWTGGGVTAAKRAFSRWAILEEADWPKAWAVALENLAK